MELTTLPGILMAILAVVCIIIALVGLNNSLKRVDWTEKSKKRIFHVTILFVVLWMVLLGILSVAGFFAYFDTIPPRPLFAVLPPIILLTILAFTEAFSIILSVTPAHWLVFFQSFRIAVELLLWQAYERGLIPVQMTFEGRNFDILAGILALFAGYIMWKRPKAARPVGIIYNLIGLALLLNIIIIAILSMPTAFRYFMNEPANTIVAHFPFIYLPGVLVVLAFTFHIFSLRQLLLKAVPTKGDHSTTDAVNYKRRLRPLK
ncbi:hypothetical protein OCK74_21420 [Chitinophagaceae bacterium LB-8]|uniref:Uncharacterized protein n=1 Tax=Paraflavisolibacter caeni TaxID=2982496 RepID=A0A9X2XZC3_9BACT|nr:hypothetical protein [Paraflavisolibacter caeni]MCU7551695.1 hypothetical protein [Paraflavisolibacter caeni]